MNTESLRIADQLRRAFSGKAWHGPDLRELLANVTAEQAAARPLPAAHSIWELVLHIEVWAHAALEATKGTPMPKIVGTEQDWRSGGNGDAAWTSARDRLFSTGEQLAQAIERFGDERLQEIVPGRKYDFYYLFHGIVQHSLYHGGQIAMLKKALVSSAAAN
jgi:uncharacterized damage-inducible protein DinB